MCFPSCSDDEKAVVDHHVLLELGFAVVSKDHGLMPPNSLYDPVRSQYRSEDLLKHLAGYRKGSKAYVAIVKADAYVYGYNYVFGHADPARGVCAVYTKRLESGDRRLYLARLSKEVLHELGHLMGLGHCSNRACVMSFSNNVKEVDAKRPAFCRSCAEALRRAAGASGMHSP